MEDLRSIADRVDDVNKTPLNPKLDVLAAPTDASRDSARQYVARLYDMLPGFMRLYSRHLERFYPLSRAVLKQLTSTQIRSLDLVLYIEQSTGHPRYEDAANLLQGGFLAIGGAEERIPECFSADALAKLKQRTAKFRLNSRF